MPRRRWFLVGTLVALAASGVVDAGAATGPMVAVRDLAVDVDPGIGGRFGGRVDVQVRFRVVNTATEPLRPTATVRVESQIGGGTASAPIHLPTIAAGAHLDVTRTIRSVLPFGSVRVVVSVRADGHTTSATGSTAVIPWFFLFTLVVLLGVALAVRRVRSSRVPHAASPGSGPSP